MYSTSIHIYYIITCSKIGGEDLTLGVDFDDSSLLECDAVCFYCALFNQSVSNSNHTASSNRMIANNELVVWNITPCSPLKFNRRFRGTCRLHLQGRIISRGRKQRESRWQLHRLILLH
jgi:hypothetical protein